MTCWRARVHEYTVPEAHAFAAHVETVYSPEDFVCSPFNRVALDDRRHPTLSIHRQVSLLVPLPLDGSMRVLAKVLAPKD
jgi:hypothetical protein